MSNNLKSIQFDYSKMAYNLKTKLNKIRKSKKNNDLPIQELITNSFYATVKKCEKNTSLNKEIIINVNFTFTENIVTEIKIEDFGIGFNEAECNSFRTMDSDENINFGCKGTGRFNIMQSFNSINIESPYNDNQYVELKLGEQYYHSDKTEGVKIEIKDGKKDRTTILLKYDQNIKIDKIEQPKPLTISDSALEDIRDKLLCKLFLMFGMYKKDGFIITINFTANEYNDVTITNKDIIDIEKLEKVTEIDGQDVNLYHIETDIDNAITKGSKNYFCLTANNVVVSKHSDVFDKFNHDKIANDKYYIGLVQSDFLDNNTTEDRSSFKEEIYEEISQIKQKVNNIIKKRYKKYFECTERDIEKKVQDIFKNYPYLSKFTKIVAENTKINDHNNKIIEKGYIEYSKEFIEHKQNLDIKIQELDIAIQEIKNQRAQPITGSLFDNDDNDSKKINQAIEEVVNAISNTSKHTLAEHVVNEFALIRKLEHYSKTDGYEEYLHEIIFPNRYILNGKTKEGTDIIINNDNISNISKQAYEKSNLWLLDDRYLGTDYEYITSNLNIASFNETVQLNKEKGRLKKLNEISLEENHIKAPDLAFFYHTEAGNEEPVLIIELKKPVNKGNGHTKDYEEAIEEGTEYAKVISTLSNAPFRYSRFIVQAIVSKIDHSRMQGKYSMIKKEQHYIRILPTNESNDLYFSDELSSGRTIQVIQEIITIGRFVELAKKKKVSYLKKLGLIKDTIKKHK